MVAGFCMILEYKGIVFSDLTVMHTLTCSHEILIVMNLNVLGDVGF